MIVPITIQHPEICAIADPISSSRIQQIAQRTLTEFATALALTALCIPFFPTWAVSIQTLATCLLIPMINIPVRIWIGQRHRWIAEFICDANFYRHGVKNAMFLVHELGHVCAIKLLFKSCPVIQIRPFSGGSTSGTMTGLTPLGRKLGYRLSTFSIVAAGTAFALTTATVILAAGLCFQQLRHQIRNYFINNALNLFFDHAYYALSALWTHPAFVVHDFVRLRSFGVSPIAATVAILAIPILYYSNQIYRRMISQ